MLLDLAFFSILIFFNCKKFTITSVANPIVTIVAVLYYKDFAGFAIECVMWSNRS